MPRFKSIRYQPAFDKLEKKPDIIFVHNIGSGSSFKIPKNRARAGAGVILKADLGRSTYEHMKRSSVYRKLIMEPFDRVDHFTTFSEVERGYLTDLGIPPEKISIIPVGINLENIPDLRLKKGSHRDKLTIGLLARFTEEKGHMSLVEPMTRLLKEYAGIRFLTAGPKTNVKYADTFIENMSVCKNFRYLGTIEHTSIYSKFYNKVDIVLVPSIEETGSITTLEAMACGKAVIASDINPHNVYITSKKNGYLAGTRDDYYKYCSELLSDPGKMIKLGSEARKSMTRYDWKMIGVRLEGLYSNLNIKG